MSDETRYFFAKFKIDDKLDVFDDVIYPRDKPTSRLGLGRFQKIPVRRETTRPPDQTAKTFADVAKDYEKIINTFQRTVPFIMQTTPIMRKIMDNRNIRSFIKANGTCLRVGLTRSTKSKSRITRN